MKTTPFGVEREPIKFSGGYCKRYKYLQILLIELIGSGKTNKTLYNGEFDPGSG